MPSIPVYLPDDLYRKIKQEPSISKTIQEALRDYYAKKKPEEKAKRK